MPLDFAVEPEALLQTVRLFLAVFLINSLESVPGGAFRDHGAGRGLPAGEKEPRGKWLLALLGLASLGSGYYIAQTADSPLKAVNVFFLAVIFVVIGTYLLFYDRQYRALKGAEKE